MEVYAVEARKAWRKAVPVDITGTSDNGCEIFLLVKLA